MAEYVVCGSRRFAEGARGRCGARAVVSVTNTLSGVTKFRCFRHSWETRTPEVQFVTRVQMEGFPL